MRREVTGAMREEHQRLKSEWEKLGKPGDFYAWILERVESHLKNNLTENLTLGKLTSKKKKNPHAVALGRIKSPAKARAVRINGRLGGRPRKNKNLEVKS